MLKLFVFLLLIISQSNANPRIKRLVGGEPAEEGQFPFLASLRVTPKKEHHCGAAIITTYFLITAGHCIDTETPNSLIVHVGSIYLYQGGTDHLIHRLAVYPDFDRNTVYEAGNDIGLIELKEALQFGNDINAINLPIGITVNPGDKVLSDGWGYITTMWYFEIDFPNTLQYSERTIISNKECSEKVDFQIGPEQICYIGEYGIGNCYGDSGSPLVYTINNSSYVVGLVSWIKRGCGTGYPSMNTNVSYYLPWIQKQLSKGRNVRRKSTLKNKFHFWKKYGTKW